MKISCEICMSGDCDLGANEDMCDNFKCRLCLGHYTKEEHLQMNLHKYWATCTHTWEVRGDNDEHVECIHCHIRDENPRLMEKVKEELKDNKEEELENGLNIFKKGTKVQMVWGYDTGRIDENGIMVLLKRVGDSILLEEVKNWQPPAIPQVPQCCDDCANVLWDYRGLKHFNKETGCMDCVETPTGRSNWQPQIQYGTSAMKRLYAEKIREVLGPELEELFEELLEIVERYYAHFEKYPPTHEYRERLKKILEGEE